MNSREMDELAEGAVLGATLGIEAAMTVDAVALQIIPRLAAAAYTAQRDASLEERAKHVAALSFTIAEAWVKERRRRNG